MFYQFAEKMGANKIDAVDIDIKCFVNTNENIKRNNCKKIKVKHSSSESLL